MPRYTDGTRVKITFDAVVTNEDGTGGGHSSDSYLLVKDVETYGYHHALFLNSIDTGAIKVEVLEEPIANWPPKRDDVWKSSTGTIYHFIGARFYRRNTVDGSLRECMTSEVQKRSPVLLWRNF